MEYKIFGCKVNKYYTDKWLNSKQLKGKQGIFIASCVVTDNAKRKWIKFVKDCGKKIQNNEQIFISGCGAFKEGKAQSDFFDIYKELFFLKDKIILLGEDPENSPHLTSPKGRVIEQKIEKDISGTLPLGGLIKLPKTLYTKKFILIQGGCDSFCTFCLTVKKRGRHYSRSKEDIVEEILNFENAGGKEVVLTGVNLSAWGLKTTILTPKLPSKFEELLKYILDNTQINRIRISSMGPEFITDNILELFKNKRIYPHFHYSVQSGSSNILKSMARHYDGKYIKKLILKTKKIKRDDNIKISIGADIIVGFPGETEENFKETYNLIKDCEISKVHAFPFSSHTYGENVPAGTFPNQINDKLKKERMWQVMNISDQIRDEFIDKNIGVELEVLIESVKETEKGLFWKGWTQNYIEADSSNFEIILGTVKRNEIVMGKLIS